MRSVWRGFSNVAWIGTALAVYATFPHTLQAAPVQSERLTYELMLGGLHVGDAMISLEQTDRDYSTGIKVTARGVAKMLQNFQADMKGQGHFITAPGGNKLEPVSYKRQWSTDEVANDMTMTFDPQTRVAVVEERLFNPTTGKALTRDELPWSKGNQSKPVPPDMRTGALDPMAAFVAARAQIMAQGVTTSGPKSFRVPIYDGNKRYDVVGKTAAVRVIAVNGVERSLMPLVARIEPVFGFTRDAEDRMREAEGKFLFTPDERFIPAQLTVTNDLGSAVMNLAADCSTDAAPCDNFGRDTQ